MDTKQLVLEFALAFQRPECSDSKLRLITTGGIIDGIPLYQKDTLHPSDDEMWKSMLRKALTTDAIRKDIAIMGNDIGFFLHHAVIAKEEHPQTMDLLFVRYDSIAAITIIS